CSSAPDLHALEVFQTVNRFLSVEFAWPIAMKVHDLRVTPLFGLEFIVEGIHEPRHLKAVLVPQRNFKNLGEWKSAHVVGSYAHANVRYPFFDAVVALIRRAKRGTGKHGDLHRALGPLLDFLPPLYGQLRMTVTHWEECRIRQLNLSVHRRRSCGCN